jgi:hypothetical protein
MATTAGTRLRCEACGSEAIVITAHDPELTCCDRPLSPMGAPTPSETKKPS